MIKIPQIIQGGMGAGVSGWTLAQAVSKLGQLGVVSGTALDQLLVRRLQDGDPAGHVRRALEAFPFRDLARRIQRTYFIPGGRKPGQPYQTSVMHTVEGRHEPQALCMVGNFVEVFLAREGHSCPVGINYLEKIQLPHLPSIYGALLAGAAVIIMGAGIPVEVPAVIDALCRHQPAQYTIQVSGDAGSGGIRLAFDPGAFFEGDAALPELARPAFLPIIASTTLASVLHRRLGAGVDGFVVEGPLAGGHNAPPRGTLKLTKAGQPIYGPRDEVDPAFLRGLGVPFWLAGAYGSPEGLRAALAVGAAGIQVGTAFALCTESGLEPTVRRELVRKALDGSAAVFTDPQASPTGFPFKVAQLEGSLSDPRVYGERRRTCDLGFLRQAYRRPDGTIGYRCPAETRAGYLAKGGKEEDLVGRKCLCNALVANIGMPQQLADGTQEQCLVTLGDDYLGIGRFCKDGKPEFSAADVIHVLLG